MVRLFEGALGYLTPSPPSQLNLNKSEDTTSVKAKGEMKEKGVEREMIYIYIREIDCSKRPFKYYNFNV